MERVQARFGLILAWPIPFRLFKLAASLQMKAFPPDGWEITYLENSNSRLAFNMTRCFYQNTLTEFGVPELTAAFCKTDDIMAEMFPATMRFVREHTLGRGDALCLGSRDGLRRLVRIGLTLSHLRCFKPMRKIGIP